MEAGTTTPAVGGSYTYSQSQMVSISAVANSGFVFDHWTTTAGSAVVAPTSASTTVTMDQDKTAVAVFRSTQAVAGQIRAIWAVVFQEGYKSQAEVDTMVAAAVQGHYNMIIVQMLAYQDSGINFHGAYWNSQIVPKAADITPSSFDPLQYLCQQAHANGLQVHVMSVPFRMCKAWPPANNSTLTSHPEWFSVMIGDIGCITPRPLSNGIYVLDPGNPDVQEYLLSIMREQLTNYPIDGIHLDLEYVSEGYYPTNTTTLNSTLARFKQITGYSGTPSTTYAPWKDFRRRVNTEIIRRAHAEILSFCTPTRQIRLSAAVNGSGNATSFSQTTAYTEFNNWEEWTRLGFLDTAMPMEYNREYNPTYAARFRTAVTNDMVWKNNRELSVGQAAYLNYFDGTLAQMQYVRDIGAEGISTYDYWYPRGSDSDPDDPYHDPSWFPLVGSGFYATPAAVPTMRWRAAVTATEGTLWGRVMNWSTGKPVDNATVQVGSLSPVQTDGNGYYVVAMANATSAGTAYTVTASASGFSSQTHTGVTVVAGEVRGESFYFGSMTDCNLNGIPDACDIDCDAPGCGPGSCGGSPDGNTNGIPDECEADILFVKPGGSGTGTSWDNALPHLQDAIGIASNPGNTVEQIWVAKGTYMPDGGYIPPGGSRTPGSGDPMASFPLVNNVAIYGGFAGTEDPATFDLGTRNFTENETILSGDLDNNDNNPPPPATPNWGNYTNNSYHVVTGSGKDNSAILDGFTITCGNANSSNNYSNEANGGGMNNGGYQYGGGPAGSPKVLNCRFMANHATSRGGAMYNGQSANPYVEKCWFESNLSDADSGAVRNQSGSPEFVDCDFVNNQSGDSGGAVGSSDTSHPTFTICRFTGNRTTVGFYGGGAVFNHADVTAVYTDCIFTSNNAYNGGAIYNNIGANVTLDGCTFTTNTADQQGGAVYGTQAYTTIKNDCAFSGNSAVSGGAIANMEGANSGVENSRFLGNHSDPGSGGAIFNRGTIEIDDCDFADNTSAGDGGAMLTQQSGSQITVRDSRFVRNASYDDFPEGGGAIHVSASEARLVNCSFLGNGAAGDGGAIRFFDGSTGSFTNCLFSGNTSGVHGGAVNMSGVGALSNVTLTNCSFTGNQARTGDGPGGAVHNGSGSLTVRNCIMWDDLGYKEIYLSGTTADIDYSCLQGGRSGVYEGGTLTWGTHNLALNPLFVDKDGSDDLRGTEDDNLRLLPGSPCIDAGTNQVAAVEYVQMRSGNGAAGQQDSLIGFDTTGPADAPYCCVFSGGTFDAARTGPHPYILSQLPAGYISGLSANPAAQWIGPYSANGNDPGPTAMYAIPFTLQTATIGHAELQLGYAVDNGLGGGPNAGVYINGQMVSPPSGITGGGFGETNVTADVTGLVHTGTNYLYLNVSDYGGPSALLFGGKVAATSTANAIALFDLDGDERIFDGDGNGTATVDMGAYEYHWVAQPTFSPDGGEYLTEQQVVITCPTADAVIHYTTNGDDPTESDPVIASGNFVTISVNPSTTLKARAFKTYCTPSVVKSATYIESPTVATPAFSPDGGQYTTNRQVTITCSTTGAVIHYTTNGNDPTESDPVIASGGHVTVTVDPATTLKARAYKPAWIPSVVKNATYSPMVVMPAFSPGGGQYTTDKQVVITCSTTGAVIHYTTNGDDPTENDPVITSGESILVSIYPPTILKARAFKSDWAPSTVKSATYSRAPVDTPFFSPDGGSYVYNLDVTITCSTTDTVIHYTTNGDDPTESSPVVASGDAVVVSVNPATTLKARAFKQDWPASAIKTATYSPKVATPYFTPDGGYYTTSQQVVIRCPTSGAEIHYTTNGNDPTSSDPVIASGDSLTVSVNPPTTLKAIAYRYGWESSDVMTAIYVRPTVDTPDFSPYGGAYDSDQQVMITCYTADATIRYTTNGVDPTESSPIVANGDYVTVSVNPPTTLKARAFKSGWISSEVRSATYTPAPISTPVFSPEGGYYVTDQQVVITCSTANAVIHYTRNGVDPAESDPVIASGDSVTVSAAPPTTLKARAFKTGWTPSDVKTAVYSYELDYVIIGTGTATWYYPLGSYYHDARTQSIYLASEIGGSRSITGLALYVTQIPGQTLNNFTIRMKHTSLSIYGASPQWESTGWTTVYQTNRTINTTGWVQFNFSTPFAYDGVQNLLVDISFNNSTYTADGHCRYSTPGGTRTLYYRTDSVYGDPLGWSAQTPTPSPTTYVPNVKLIVQVASCYTPKMDTNGDLHVDAIDFDAFSACYNGPTNLVSGDCLCLDANGDQYVDAIDFDAFSGCYNGPTNPPRCGG